MGSLPPPSNASRQAKCLLLTLLLAFSSLLPSLQAYALPSLVPEDIAYKPKAEGTSGAAQDSPLVGTAEIPAPSTSTTQPVSATQKTGYAGVNLCPDHSGNHVNLQKSLVITRFLRAAPPSANAGNLYAVESGVPSLIHTQLTSSFQSISPGVIELGFAPPGATETQLKRQAQQVARRARAQFVLSGTIDDMSMTAPDATYNPGLYRQAANAVHDITTIRAFDKRTRVLQLSVQLRDGLTGETLFNKQFSTSGIWNTRKPTGFGSPAFYKTHYGKRIKSLSKKISRELAEVIHCQPFMANIDSQPGQTQILLHGGANNGLHAGDTLNLYQVVVVGSNTEYQVNETRLVKRDARLYLSEVYPSHSIAQVEGGNYLNGHYIAVGE